MENLPLDSRLGAGFDDGVDCFHNLTNHWMSAGILSLFSFLLASVLVTGCPTDSDDDVAGDDDVSDDDIGDDDTSWVQIDAEYHLSCGLRANGRAECWGDEHWGATAPPEDVEFDQVASGGIYHACGIARSGEMECWGSDEFGGITHAPEGPQIDVDISGESCAIAEDLSLNCWGFFGTSTPMQGEFSHLSLGDHLCALRSGGTVECLGDNDYGQLDAPAGTFVQVAAGWMHSCGLRDDGAVECWGCGDPHDYGQCDPPTGYTFERIEAGEGSYGITTDHELVCWPDHEGCNPYGRQFVQISRGSPQVCGITVEGEVLCWGCDPDWDYGECDPPQS